MSTSLLDTARYRGALLAAAHSQFSHSHTLGDENVRKSPANPGNPRVSAILMGGEKPEGVRKPLAADSHDSHTDENTLRTHEKASGAVLCAQCGTAAPLVVGGVHLDEWQCRACCPDTATELRRRDLAAAMEARADALTGIVAAARAEEDGPLYPPNAGYAGPRVRTHKMVDAARRCLLGGPSGGTMSMRAIIRAHGHEPGRHIEEQS